jgi:hypothetical protein
MRAREESRRRPPPAAGRPRWGELPARFGVSLVIVSAALGALVTVLARAQPGLALGCFLVAGAAGAALAVRARSVYRILPVPALAYLVSATMAGLIHDRGTAISLTSLLINAAQWIASGFVAMTAATVLITVVTVVRLYRSWRRRQRGSRPPRAGSGAPGRPRPV